MQFHCKRSTNLCTIALSSALLFSSSAMATATDEQSGKSIQIQGMGNPVITSMLEQKLLDSAKNDDFDTLAELVLEANLEIDESQMSDALLVYKPTESASFPVYLPSDENTSQAFIDLIILIEGKQTGDVQAVENALSKIPDIAEPTPSRQYDRLMVAAVGYHNTSIIKLLNDKCGDCAFSRSGASLIHTLTTSRQGFENMNLNTFKLLHEGGGIAAFESARPDASIFNVILNLWIPEPDGGYSDHIVTAIDKLMYSYRKEQRVAILQYLVDQEFDVNDTFGKNNSSVVVTTAYGGQDKEALDLLLNNGVDPTIGDNPLFRISPFSSIELTKVLLDYGYDPTDVDKEGDTLLIKLAKETSKYNAEMLELIGDSDIDINARNAAGYTALDYRGAEYFKESKPFTKWLLGKGAVESDLYLNLALLQAIEDGQQENVESIIAKRPKLVNGMSNPKLARDVPLHRAIGSGNNAIFEYLLKQGASVDSTDERGALMLQHAIYTNNAYAFQTLINNGANPNRTRERDGVVYTHSFALNEAATNGQLGRVIELLARGAIFDGMPDMYDKSLFRAASNGHYEVTKALLDAGADANLNYENETIVDVLREYQVDQKVVDLLLEYGAKE